MPAGILYRQASDLTVSVKDHLADCFTTPRNQRDIHHGAIAGPAGDRRADALEAASGVRHVPPPAGEPVHEHVIARPRVEFRACLPPTTLDEVTEQRTCPGRRIWWDVLGHCLAPVLPRRPPGSSCRRLLVCAVRLVGASPSCGRCSRCSGRTGERGWPRGGLAAQGAAGAADQRGRRPRRDCGVAVHDSRIPCRRSRLTAPSAVTGWRSAWTLAPSKATARRHSALTSPGYGGVALHATQSRADDGTLWRPQPRARTG
jgi:hypothetical protein